MHQQALKLNRAVNDRRSEGYTLGNCGKAYAALGQHQKALKFFKQNLDIAVEMTDPQSEGCALFGSSHSLWVLGKQDEAIANAERALKLFEEIEDALAAKVRKQLDLWRSSS